jgi:hypothetical protein
MVVMKSGRPDQQVLDISDALTVTHEPVTMYHRKDCASIHRKAYAKTGVGTLLRNKVSTRCQIG